MNVVNFWKEAITFLSPRTSKLLYLVALKTIARTYYLVATRLWWLVLAVIGLRIAYPITLWPVLPYCSLVLEFALLCGICLSARASILPKEWRYYASYIPKCIYMAPIIAAALRFMALYLATPLLCLTFLFYCDSPGTFLDIIVSVRRALLMIFYLFPVFLCIALVQFLIHVILVYFNISPLVEILLAPIFIGIIATVYTKHMHDHFSLYYPLPQQGKA